MVKGKRKRAAQAEAQQGADGKLGSIPSPSPSQPVQDDLDLAMQEDLFGMRYSREWFPGFSHEGCGEDCGGCSACGECELPLSPALVDERTQALDKGPWNWSTFITDAHALDPVLEKQHTVREQNRLRQEKKRRLDGEKKRDQGGNPKITQHFQVQPHVPAVAPLPPPVDVDDTDDEDTPPLHYTTDYAELQRLLAEGIANAKRRGDSTARLAYLAVARYHSFISGTDPKPRLPASVAVASILYYDGTSKRTQPFKYRAERIRANLKYFARNRALPPDKRRKGPSNPSRIFEVAFQAKCRVVIVGLEARLKSKEWSAQQFHAALVDHLRSDGTLGPSESVSPMTACFYLRYNGHGARVPEEGDLQGRSRAGRRGQVPPGEVLPPAPRPAVPNAALNSARHLHWIEDLRVHGEELYSARPGQPSRQQD